MRQLNGIVTGFQVWIWSHYLPRFSCLEHGAGPEVPERNRGREPTEVPSKRNCSIILLQSHNLHSEDGGKITVAKKSKQDYQATRTLLNASFPFPLLLKHTNSWNMNSFQVKREKST